jgi:Tfp pilus assembly protein PilF
MDLYVPVTYTWWGVLAAISPRHPPDPDGFTLSPTVYHIANLALHAISAIAVLQILRRLVRNELAALVGACFYAMHPIQVESLGWISGGKDVLSGTLGLIAIWMYVAFVQTPVQLRRRKYLYYGAATLAFILATLSKPQAVSVPVVIFLLDVLLLRRNWRAAILSLAIWLVWCVPVILIGRNAQPASLLYSPIVFRPIVSLDALAFYLGKILWPIHLAVDYGRSPRWLIASPQRFWTWVVPVALLLASYLLRRKLPAALAATLMFIAALAPVLGLIGFDYQTYSTVTDHYLYLALLAPSLLLASVLANASWKHWIAPICLVLIACGVLSFRQTFVWRDTKSLFEHTRKVNSQSLAASGMLGMYWSDHRDPQRALEVLSESVRLHPDVPFAHFTYANVLMRENKIAEAIQEYRQAIDQDASKPKYFTNFGVALARSNRPDLALVAFQHAAELDPKDADNYQNAGIALEAMGRIEQAKLAFKMALERDPSRQAIREHLAQLSAAPPNAPSR